MGLDLFLPSTANQKPVEERCAGPGCRKIIRGVKYALTIKGETKSYCAACAKRILRPQENSEADL